MGPPDHQGRLEVSSESPVGSPWALSLDLKDACDHRSMRLQALT
jgi:hypothetical protein